jgi:hypothetical protein
MAGSPIESAVKGLRSQSKAFRDRWSPYATAVEYVVRLLDAKLYYDSSELNCAQRAIDSAFMIRSKYEGPNIALPFFRTEASSENTTHAINLNEIDALILQADTWLSNIVV